VTLCVCLCTVLSYSICYLKSRSIFALLHRSANSCELVRTLYGRSYTTVSKGPKFLVHFLNLQLLHRQHVTFAQFFCGYALPNNRPILTRLPSVRTPAFSLYFTNWPLVYYSRPILDYHLCSLSSLLSSVAFERPNVLCVRQYSSHFTLQLAEYRLWTLVGNLGVRPNTFSDSAGGCIDLTLWKVTLTRTGTLQCGDKCSRYSIDVYSQMHLTWLPNITWKRLYRAS